MSEPPALPPGLLKASRDRWTAFWASPAADKVNRESDMPRLIRWIEQTDEYDRVAKTCRKARLVKGSMGQPVLNPLISYLNQLEAQISRAESEFGMTPLARHRIEGAPGTSGRGRVTKPSSKGGAGVTDIAARIAARRRGTAG